VLSHAPAWSKSRRVIMVCLVFWAGSGDRERG